MQTNSWCISLGVCFSADSSHVISDSAPLTCGPQPAPVFHHLSSPIFFFWFFLSLHLFVSCSPPPSPPSPPPTLLYGCPPFSPPPLPLDSCPPDPLAGATPPIGRLSRCVHPLSLTTTSQARRATWRTPSRALHALHLLIRGTARTGTPTPLPSMPLYTF